MIRIRVAGPLEPYRAGIEGELHRLGYSQGRATMLMLLVAHISRWMDDRHVGPRGLTDEAVSEFFAAWSRTWCRSPQSFAPALAYLRSVGAAPARSPSRVGATPSEVVLWESFGRWCVGQRGLKLRTAEKYIERAETCLRLWRPEGELNLASSIPLQCWPPSVPPLTGCRARVPLRGGPRCGRCCGSCMPPVVRKHRWWKPFRRQSAPQSDPVIAGPRGCGRGPGCQLCAFHQSSRAPVQAVRPEPGGHRRPSHLLGTPRPWRPGLEDRCRRSCRPRRPPSRRRGGPGRGRNSTPARPGCASFDVGLVARVVLWHVARGDGLDAKYAERRPRVPRGTYKLGPARVIGMLRPSILGPSRLLSGKRDRAGSERARRPGQGPSMPSFCSYRGRPLMSVSRPRIDTVDSWAVHLGWRLGLVEIASGRGFQLVMVVEGWDIEGST